MTGNVTRNGTENPLRLSRSNFGNTGLSTVSTRVWKPQSRARRMKSSEMLGSRAA